MKKMPSNKELGIRPTRKDHRKAAKLIREAFDMPSSSRTIEMVCPGGAHYEVGSYLKFTTPMLSGYFKVIREVSMDRYILEEDTSAHAAAEFLIKGFSKICKGKSNHEPE